MSQDCQSFPNSIPISTYQLPNSDLQQSWQFPSPIPLDSSYDLLECLNSSQFYTKQSTKNYKSSYDDQRMILLLDDIQMSTDNSNDKDQHQEAGDKNIKQGNITKEDKFNKAGETKNIPKNFGKQIIKFVCENQQLVRKILYSIGSQANYDDLKQELRQRRKKMNKISNIKNLWTSQIPYSREMRTISNQFLRRHAPHWIFNSRIQNYTSHIKYRWVLQLEIKNPDKFVCLKSNL